MSSPSASLLAPQSDIEDFSRFEFKYILSNGLASVIQRDIEHFMRFDGHGSAEDQNSYYVRSLYFDNRRRQNYYDKIDGIKARRKFRLRTYIDEPNSTVPVFLEEKNRVNNRVFKYRTRLESDSLAICESESDIAELKLRFPENALVDRFIARRLSAQESPTIMISYLRRAFVSNYDINFRITLDSELQSAPSDCLFGGLPGQVVSCLAGYTIMEIKFTRRIPSWFHRILQCYQLQRLSVSKYCKGMEACRLAVDLS